MSAAVQVTVDGGVAVIETGRNKGWSVAIGTAARQFLEGHETRANMVDALALSAGYLDALEQIKSLRAKLKRVPA